MVKAQEGDLIRIVSVPEDWSYDVGGIYEVISISNEGYPRFYIDDTEDIYYALPGQYMIHRKAGEEDDRDKLIPREVAIKNAADALGDLIIRKNHDYGDSFSQQYDKYGLMSALIRMDDKLRRLETLQGGDKAKVSESISDTLLDLAGYALLTYVETQK
ncbi:nucleotide modification associated domain-containing protein [Lysinibacillus capsici]|uniref:nucleotide modification associated domain-containing protein n=1 Tax=Lysinibacillus capsici TaxID=2115968 RepID=UPI001FC912A7|nr:nucleotide modification associated domain-containing protein [Lysinibacillus capsici]